MLLPAASDTRALVTGRPVSASTTRPPNATVLTATVLTATVFRLGSGTRSGAANSLPSHPRVATMHAETAMAPRCRNISAAPVGRASPRFSIGSEGRRVYQPIGARRGLANGDSVATNAPT